IAERIKHSPERVEVALREAIEVLIEEPVLITKTKQGIITDFSGVDESNAPPGSLIALPDNPDESARRINNVISRSAGFNIPVIITDTHGRPWRRGAVNKAIGVAGMSPFVRNAGKEDIYGYELKGSLVCLVDQLASATELIMGQADEGVPVVILRGVAFEDEDGSASMIIRSASENLFR
ncbi:MAG: coenzyme F420-0:L-glutamate ligase, partial [Promethearchaeota archaeon]